MQRVERIVSEWRRSVCAGGAPVVSKQMEKVTLFVRELRAVSYFPIKRLILIMHRGKES